MNPRAVTEALFLAGLIGLAGWSTARAADVADLIAPYLRALGEHQVGEVVGRALGDPARPSAPPVPYEGVSVVLVPRSIRLDSELDEIKDHYRDSLKDYMGAAADLVAARTTYESALVWAGGGELIRGEVTDAQGIVRLAGVPAGEWSLVAWREEESPGSIPRHKPREMKGFRGTPISVGHSVVRYWVMRLHVGAGETTSVALNDRNVWIAAVREHLIPTDEAPSGRGGRRRGH
jgi:hypothetical protein